ncbi:hypothetical protein CEP53_003759 [Fusarium sp. AF-6]|nr:hypothetical protein CEP53_003759 [Fusarium sp. AF-6]
MWLLSPRGNSAPTAAQILSASVILLAGFLLRYINRGYQIRKRFQALKAQGIPIMEHSIIFGHLKVVRKLMSNLPSDAYPDYLQLQLQDNWRQFFPQCTKCPPMVYLDAWPLSDPLIVSLNVDISSQFTQQHSMPRFRDAKDFFYPLTKNRDIVTMEDAEWKILRKRLSVGFGAQCITSRVPDIVEEVEEFVQVLKSKAGRKYCNPWRHFKLWKNYRTLTQELIPPMQRRLAELQADSTIPRKTLIDLIVQALEEEAVVEQESGREKPRDLIGLANDSLEVVVGLFLCLPGSRQLAVPSPGSSAYYVNIPPS